jgi:CheY-like chemotaxis protein
LILLVEDNPTDVFVIRQVVKECGLECELQVAIDGESAIELLRKVEADINVTCPALVLLDLNLPKLSGVDVLKLVRQGKRCSQVPIVIVTSSDSTGDMAAIQAGGATAYFRKPSDLTRFMDLGKLIGQVLGEQNRAR